MPLASAGQQQWCIALTGSFAGNRLRYKIETEQNLLLMISSKDSAFRLLANDYGEEDIYAGGK